MSAVPTFQGFGDNGVIVKQRLPRWVRHARPESFDHMGRHLQLEQGRADALAPWFTQASEAEQRTLLTCQQHRLQATHRLARDLGELKGLMAFAEPRLCDALREQLGVELDVNRHEFIEVRYDTVLINQFLNLKRQSLLQAALQNYAADATFDKRSALAPLGSLWMDYSPSDGSPANAVYRLRTRLDIDPQRFARLCHGLDLGGQYQRHLSVVYDNPATRSRLRRHGIALTREMLRVDLQVAAMSGAISEAAQEAVMCMLSGRTGVRWKKRPLQVRALQMFGATLDSVLLLGADEGPLMCWLPGAAIQPLKEFTDFKALDADLQQRSRRPDFQHLLASYVSHAEQPHVFSRLDKALFRWRPLKRGKVREPTEHADLYLTCVPMKGDIFAQLHDNHIARLRQNALAMAVPSAQVDEQAAEARRKHWENLALDFANLAAFFLPGLGAVMAVVTAVQLVEEVVEGVKAWTLGDMDEVWGHVASVGLNVAVLAGFGLVHQAVSGASEMVDGLLPVALPDGSIKLWKPDLAPYVTNVELAGTAADTRGLHAHKGKHYLRLDERVHEVFTDTDGLWRVRHPDDPHAYAPELRHNGQGAWWFEGEQPRYWPRLQLLRRLGTVTERLDDEALLRAAQISAVSDDVLRAVYLDGTPMPGLLADCLLRARLGQRVDRLVDAVRHGTPMDAPLGFVARLAVKLPGWPKRPIEVLDGNVPIVYGRARWPHGEPLRLKLADLSHERLAQAILQSLPAEEVENLLGSERQPEHDTLRLRALLAEQVLRRRSQLLERYHADSQLSQREQAVVLKRDFPLLPDTLVDELLEHWVSTPAEQVVLGSGKVPLRLAQEARLYQRQVRLSRAIEGIEQEGVTSVDSDRLCLGLLEQLPGWPPRTRWVLTDLAQDGQAFATIGPDDGPAVTLVRDQGLYHRLGAGNDTLGLPFSEAVLNALGDAGRSAIGLTVSDAAALRLDLFDAAVADRDRASRLLGQRPAQGWFRSPLRLADGRVGYPMGGSIGTLASADGRLDRLYPTMTGEERRTLKLRLLQRHGQLAGAINALEEELAGLMQRLAGWSGGAQEAPLSEFERTNRRQMARRLVTCWRRAPVAFADKLDLSGFHVSRLPVMSGNFDHVHGLELGNMGLTDLPLTFAGVFRKLRELSLRNNRLSEIPLPVGYMAKLTGLDLSGNRLDLGAPATALLGRLRQLTHLELQFNEQPLTDVLMQVIARLPLRVLKLGHNTLLPDGQRVEAIGRMARLQYLSLAGTALGRAPALDRLVRLRALNLSDCALDAWPEGLEALMSREPCTLYRVDLDHNAITQLPDLSGTRFASLLHELGPREIRFDVRRNPLSVQALENLRALQPLHDLLPEGLDPGLGFWLVDTTVQQQALWQWLLEVAANRSLFEVLGRLSLARDVQAEGAAMRGRVWEMLQEAADHADLLGELQQIAEQAPITCGDAGADTFSEMETAMLVARETRMALNLADNSRRLVQVYTRLYRRAQVQRLADRLALRRALRLRALNAGSELPALDPLDSITDDALRPTVDDVEIRLYVRQQTAGPLDFPEPSSGMLFSGLAKVDQGVIKRIIATVRELDSSALRRAWLVELPNWQRYVRQAHALAFDEALQPWREGLEYLESCMEPAVTGLPSLTAEVSEVLVAALPEPPLDGKGKTRRLVLDEQQYLDAVAALQQGQAKAEQVLMHDLTAAEQLQAEGSNM